MPTVLTEHEVRYNAETLGGDPAAHPAKATAAVCSRRVAALAALSGHSLAARRSDSGIYPRDAAAISTLAPAVVPRLRINPFGIALPPCADHSRTVENTIVFVGGSTIGRMSTRPSGWQVRLCHCCAPADLAFVYRSLAASHRRASGSSRRQILPLLAAYRRSSHI